MFSANSSSAPPNSAPLSACHSLRRQPPKCRPRSTGRLRPATPLDKIGALKPGEASFGNTIRALDDVGYENSLTEDRLSLMKETSTNAGLRDASTEALKKLEEWSVGLDYRLDVYKTVKAYADTKPKLKGEDARLFEETMRDYRRAGLDLPKETRDEVERMRKELSGLTTDFESNITKAQRPLKFARAELEGVPEDFLSQAKSGDDE